MEERILNDLMKGFYGVGLGEFVELHEIESTIKKILSLKEHALEFRISMLRKDLKVYGLNDEEIDDLINSIVIKQLEDTKEINYDLLEDIVTAHAYLKGIEENNVTLEFVDEEEHVEYNDNLAFLASDDNYALIFVNAFNALDEKTKNVIMSVLINQDEYTEEYVSATNKLVEIIYEIDEVLADLVKEKMLKTDVKTLKRKQK